MQRNRFEHLNGRFVPDDQIGVKKQGDDGTNDAVRKDQYKYALGNENVIDAHVYQIDPKLPKSFGGKVWLGLGPSRNTPYVPFYGNVQDTYKAFKPQTATYDPNSWYWTVWHIDQMAIKNQDIFGKSVQDHWKELEKQWIIEQKARDDKYAALKGNEEAAKAAESEVTNEALARSERLFGYFKNYEAQMQAQLAAAGRKDDPYRASLPDDYKEPSTPEKEPEKESEKPAPGQEPEKKPEDPAPSPEPEKTPDTTVANAAGNPNNRFGYAATKGKITSVQVFEQPKSYGEAPSSEPEKTPQTTVVNTAGNPNNRFGYAASSEGGKNFKNVETFVNTK